MSTIRNLVFIVVIAMLFISGCTTQAPATPLPVKAVTAPIATAAQTPPTAIPEPTQEIDPALLAAMEKCANTLPGQACLVEGPVKVTTEPEQTFLPFEEPGQTLNLANIRTLKLGEAGSTKGMVVLHIQTEWPGGAFTAVAFGEVELVNEVLPGMQEYNPMQSLTLTTGENEEEQVPGNGLLVASPDDGNLSTLVVNGLELSFGSGGWLTSQGGGLTIQTLWGSIGTWFQDRVIQVKKGFGIRLTYDELKREIYKEPYRDYKYESFKRALEKYFGNKELSNEPPSKNEPYDPAYKTVSEALKKYFGCEDWKTNPGCGHYKEETAADKKMLALEELRRKQKPWIGGWWKMTYGPVAMSGQCEGVVVADGYGGESGEPFTTEIPICRGNNGNTVLMYESGVSYDRIGPNLFAQSSVTEFDLYGNGNYSIEGTFTTLQMVSPTRMILSNSNSESDSCTTTSVVYLDFVRDDPNVRCGYIIYIDPYEPPELPTPTPEPENVEPPLEGQYQVRINPISKACDPGAQPFAPSFTTAGLSLSPEGKLVVDAATTKYELELTDLTYNYYSEKTSLDQDRLGIFSLQQPLDSSFNLMMSLMQVPAQQWTGNWLVTNEDGTKSCGGSIDLLPPE